MHLFLVRHGETDWNFFNKLQGKSNIELNDNGRRQAYLVHKQLENVKFDYCFASPLKRAVETAQIISRLPIITDERLIERGMGELEGKHRKHYNPKLYWNYEINSNLNGVEDLQSLFSRTECFMRDLKNNYADKTILVVSHGATIRALNYIIKGYNSKTNFLDMKIANCCVLEYNI